MHTLISLLAATLASASAPGAPAAAVPVARDASLPLDAVAAHPVALVSPYAQDEEAGEEEVEYGWSVSVQGGVGVTTGSAETTSGNVKVDAADRQEKDRKTFGFWWNYQQDNDASPKVAQRRTGLSAQYDRFLNEETYWLLTGLVESDLAAGVDLRWTAGVGLGHQFQDTETYAFSAEAGLSYYVEKLDDASDKDYPALRLAYTSHWTPNDRYEILHTGLLIPALEDVGDSDWSIYAKLDTTAKLNLTETMFASLNWVLDWNSVPPPDASEANNRVFLNVGWTL